jgi:hypothetical protein
MLYYVKNQVHSSKKRFISLKQRQLMFFLNLSFLILIRKAHYKNKSKKDGFSLKSMFGTPEFSLLGIFWNNAH